MNELPDSVQRIFDENFDKLTYFLSCPDGQQTDIAVAYYPDSEVSEVSLSVNRKNWPVASVGIGRQGLKDLIVMLQALDAEIGR